MLNAFVNVIVHPVDSLAPAFKWASGIFNDRLFWTKRSFARVRADFYKDLAERMKASRGKNIASFLEKDARRYPKLARGKMCAHWLGRFEAEGKFYKAIRGTVPEDDIATLRVAEEAGDLAVGLMTLSRGIVAIDRGKTQFLTVAATAIALFGLLHVLLAIIGFKLMPTITRSINLPVDLYGPIGTFFHYLSIAIQNWMLPWLLVLAGGGVWVTWSLRNYVGRYRSWLDSHVIVYELYREYKGAQFLLALASITQKIGNKVINPDDALGKLRVDASPWLRWHIDKIRMNLFEKPNSGGEVFATGVMNKDLTYRMMDISEYAELGETLQEVAGLVMSKTPEVIVKRANRLRIVVSVACVSLMMVLYYGVIFMNREFASVLERQMLAY